MPNKYPSYNFKAQMKSRIELTDFQVSLMQAQTELGIFVIQSQSGGINEPNVYIVTPGGTYDFDRSVRSLVVRMRRMGYSVKVLDHPNPDEYVLRIEK